VGDGKKLPFVPDEKGNKDGPHDFGGMVLGLRGKKTQKLLVRGGLP